MKNILFVVLCLISTRSYAETVVRVDTIPRGDNFFHNVQIKLDRTSNVIIDTTVSGNLLQSVLTDPDVIDVIFDGDIHVDFTSEVGFAGFDPSYNPGLDTLFNDATTWVDTGKYVGKWSIFEPDGLGGNIHISDHMRVIANTISLTDGGPITKGNFLPIWYVVSPSDDIMVTGSITFPGGKKEYFSNRVPEPSSIILIISGVMLFCVYRKKR